MEFLQMTGLAIIGCSPVTPEFGKEVSLGMPMEDYSDDVNRGGIDPPIVGGWVAPLSELGF